MSKKVITHYTEETYDVRLAVLYFIVIFFWVFGVGSMIVFICVGIDFINLILPSFLVALVICFLATGNKEVIKHKVQDEK